MSFPGVFRMRRLPDQGHPIGNHQCSYAIRTLVRIYGLHIFPLPGPCYWVIAIHQGEIEFPRGHQIRTFAVTGGYFHAIGFRPR